MTLWQLVSLHRLIKSLATASMGLKHSCIYKSCWLRGKCVIYLWRILIESYYPYNCFYTFLIFLERNSPTLCWYNFRRIKIQYNSWHASKVPNLQLISMGRTGYAPVQTYWLYNVDYKGGCFPKPRAEHTCCCLKKGSENNFPKFWSDYQSIKCLIKFTQFLIIFPLFDYLTCDKWFPKY